MDPNPTFDLQDSAAAAARIRAEIAALPVQNTPGLRSVRKHATKRLREASPDFILALARVLRDDGHWMIPCELIREHPAAFQRLDMDTLEALGQGMDSWGAVDTFARTLSGPAWLAGLVPDEAIHRWARADDRWWRRAALVSTVALNVRSHGGPGDAPRTLSVCRLLVDDTDDMVVKALSWALRELISHDPGAVRRFLAAHDEVLAARVKREVRNKLDTGLKSPRRGTR